MLRPLLVALQFLTIIPVTFQQAPSVAETRQSLLWYPFVGALVGGLLCLVAAGFLVLVPGLPLLQSALVLLIWVLVTGGLHLDGLADCADAWMGGRGDRERALLLLKDPTCGTMAALALNLLLITKFSALAALFTQHGPWPLFVVPILGRMVLLPLLATTRYVRVGGLGAELSQYAVSPAPTAVTGVTVTAVILSLHQLAVVLLFVALIVTCWIRWLANHHLGGLTGDVAGAAVEIVEASALIAIVLMPSS